MDSFENICAIVLAAGKGTRMNLKTANKVTCQVAGEPLISRTIKNLRGAGVSQILVVVGHAKDSVVSLLDKDVKTVEQRKRLGTGHAVKVAAKHLPNNISSVMVVYGDDSFLYSPEILQKLLKFHQQEKSTLSFLTTEVDNPFGLGRILRNQDNEVIGIVEEKNATEEQRKIKEINPACYIFNVGFLKKYLPKIPKNPLKGEYYLTDLIELAVKNNEPLEALKDINLQFRGVNTAEELQEAEKMLLEVK